MANSRRFTPPEDGIAGQRGAPRSDSPGALPPLPSVLLGTYRVEGLLGAGGMGVVYRATHLALARGVAIKLPTLVDPELVERFVREGRVLAGLQHPNLVRVYDAGQEDSRPYIVLELVRGCALSALGAGQKLPVEHAVALVLQLLDGLGYAHSRGVLHRDVKSENALLTREGALKLADFGLARADSEAGLTRDGTIMGTPAYMSPEQARGGPLDARSDLYSVAVVLFELIAGQLPFRSEKVLDLLAMQMREPPPPLGMLARDVPERVAEAVARGLAKDPGARFATAEDFADCLRLAVSGQALERAASGLPAIVNGRALEALVVAGTAFLTKKVAPGPQQPFATAGEGALTLSAGVRTKGASPEGQDSEREHAGAANWLRVFSRGPARLALGGLFGALVAVTLAAVAWWRPGSPSGQDAVLQGHRTNRTAAEGQAPAVAFGAIQVVSRPPGARVVGQDGSDTGQVTPGSVERLTPGKWTFWLELAGFARTQVSTVVIAGETRHVEAELEQKLVPMGRNPQTYQEFLNPVDGSILIAIPGDSFEMGSASGSSDERPAHRVRLSPYYIGKYEVTWKRYLVFCAAKQHEAPTRPAWAGDEHPVVNVSWLDARDYCQWAGLELPTEAQWEFAARGPNGLSYPWGPQEPLEPGVCRANYSPVPAAADGFEYTAPVGSYGPDARSPLANGSSPVGALDMAGNVWEWCADWYASDYHESLSPRDPTGPSAPSLSGRVLRGGSWSNTGAWLVHGSVRGKCLPTLAMADYGFRVARSYP